MGESEFERVKREYLQRLQHQLRRVPAALREDAIHEVLAHIEDGCRQSPNDLADLQAVLRRLGPPEEYGRELGMQLLLQANRAHPSLNLLIWTGIFWASTSVVGAFVVVGATLFYILGLSFVIDGLVRLIDPSTHLTMIRLNDTVVIPAWWPPLNILTGTLILYLMTYGLFFIVRGWGQPKLSRRGLAVTLNRDTIVLQKGWEGRATVAIIMTAIFGFLGCSIFGEIGGLLPISRSGPMSLPGDFFKNPFTFLAFLGMMAFLLSPVLGILWAARREQTKKQPDEDQAANTKE